MNNDKSGFQWDHTYLIRQYTPVISFLIGLGNWRLASVAFYFLLLDLCCPRARVNDDTHNGALPVGAAMNTTSGWLWIQLVNQSPRLQTAQQQINNLKLFQFLIPIWVVSSLAEGWKTSGCVSSSCQGVQWVKGQFIGDVASSHHLHKTWRFFSRVALNSWPEDPTCLIQKPDFMIRLTDSAPSLGTFWSSYLEVVIKYWL